MLLGKTQDTTHDQLLCASLCALYGYAFWRFAGPFATVKAPGWEKEQSQVEAWWQALTSSERRQDVIEFSTGSFWREYYTYRLVRPGPYWVTVKIYKRWGRPIPWEYRVRELSSVSFTALPGAQMKVRIGKRTMRAVNMSPTILDGARESPLPKIA
jgi:hypothetical protein